MSLVIVQARRHVDSGKSTTIGRLIFELGGLPERELGKLKQEAERSDRGSSYLSAQSAPQCGYPFGSCSMQPLALAGASIARALRSGRQQRRQRHPRRRWVAVQRELEGGGLRCQKASASCRSRFSSTRVGK